MAEHAATFPGYPRPDGSAGTRNLPLVVPTVACAAHVAYQIAAGVPRAVALAHQHGCAQIGADAEATSRTLAGTGANPNVGAVLVVGLGCEQVTASRLAEAIAQAGKPVETVSIQELGGTSKAIARGRERLLALAHELEKQGREPCPLERLVVATECGGSDSFSGLTANPVVGAVADRAIAAGATVIVSETTELIGAEHLLAQRAASPQVGEQARQMVLRWEATCRAYGARLTGANPSPGNIEGGITTIEEKSLGCLHKGGTSPVQEVLDYAQRPSRRGLVLMDTPGNDVESIAGMAAGGATLVLFTTGRGTPLGCAVAPVIKIASNTALAQRMGENVDFNAGRVADGAARLEDAAEQLWSLLLEVAAGRLARAEELGHREFAIRRTAPTL
ncbi:MAG: UxaA family hydrolase [Candidatus Brocadiia bacterium]